MTGPSALLTPWSDAQRSAYLQGQAAIAAKRAEVRAKTHPYNRRVSDVQIVEAIALRGAGVTWPQITRLLDVRDSAIRAAVQRYLAVEEVAA